MEKKDKENWINDTLGSIEGIKQAEASPFLYTKVLHRIKSESRAGSVISTKKAALGFLTMFLLAALNITLLFGFNSTETETQSVLKSSDVIPSQTNPYLEILSK